ncbi:hypothetical protein HPB47_006110 [Ixodes persulcatus]|uniref:Uncharacterized protein n=1 Tax=Ixodes persulcatus TaxID=34615 RepID=A0AC60PB91_IXOPE|nr:hypothetical protein HPB47_006110 [Ixodes persulcatus]
MAIWDRRAVPPSPHRFPRSRPATTAVVAARGSGEVPPAARRGGARPEPPVVGPRSSQWTVCREPATDSGGTSVRVLLYLDAVAMDGVAARSRLGVGRASRG